MIRMPSVAFSDTGEVLLPPLECPNCGEIYERGGDVISLKSMGSLPTIYFCVA